MTKLTILASTALALSVAALPLTASFDRGGLHIKAHSAFAKDGHSGGDGGSSGSGSGGSDSSGSGSSGSSGHGGGDDGGSSGGGDDGGNDDGGNGGDDDASGDDSGSHGAEHIDPETGAKVEVSGNSIEVRHANGVKEELEDGRYEMKDAGGRTIVERTATADDIARLTALAN